MTNPYESPESASSARVPFRSNLVLRAFYMVLRGNKRFARRDPGTGELVFEPSQWVRGLYWFSIVGWPIVVAFFPEAVDVSTLERLSSLASVPILVAAGVMGVVTSERFRVSAEGIKQERPFFRKGEIPWQKVVSVRINRMGSLKISLSSGVQFKVGADLVGVAEFADMLEKYLPRNVLRDCEADLDAFREFVN